MPTVEQLRYLRRVLLGEAERYPDAWGEEARMAPNGNRRS